MPLVFIPSQIRELTGGLAEIEVEASTVLGALNEVDRRFPGVKARLCRGDSLAPGLQISVDHVMTRRGLEATLGPESEVHFLPIIGGG